LGVDAVKPSMILAAIIYALRRAKLMPGGLVSRRARPAAPNARRPDDRGSDKPPAPKK
jgi:hypothetical protein